MTHKKIPLTLMTAATLAAFVLAGCEGFNRATGRTKQSPDEFQVIVNPPLSLPPGFSLRPITEEDAATARARRPSGGALGETARTLGAAGDGAAARGFDDVFGTSRAEAGIRETVDRETLGVIRDRTLPHQSLFGNTPAVGPELSAEEEARRIRELQERGEAITATPTPARDPQSSDTLTVR